MVAVNYSIEIKSDVQTIWDTMLAPDTYNQWTKAFHPGSSYEGSWEQGSEIRFVAQGENGKSEGMYSFVKENVLHKKISLEHKGIIKDGIVDTESEEVKKWAPSYENYTFTVNGDSVEVLVEMQLSEEYVEHFDGMWKKALQALKELCEK